MPIYRVPVLLSYPAAGSPGVNVHHFLTTEEDAEAGAVAASALLEAFYTSLQGSVISRAASIAWDGVATDVTTGEQVQGDPFALAGGAFSMAPLPIAIVVGWRTGTAARSGVGRTFLGPLAEATMETNGTPTIAALTAARNAASNLIAGNDSAFGDTGSGMGVYSRTTGLLRRFTAARVRDSFATIRSRRD